MLICYLFAVFHPLFAENWARIIFYVILVIHLMSEQVPCFQRFWLINALWRCENLRCFKPLEIEFKRLLLMRNISEVGVKEVFQLRIRDINLRCSTEMSSVTPNFACSGLLLSAGSWLNVPAEKFVIAARFLLVTTGKPYYLWCLLSIPGSHHHANTKLRSLTEKELQKIGSKILLPGLLLGQLFSIL